MRRFARGFVRTLAAGACAAAAILPLAAGAAPADDYIAARDTAVATLAAAEKAGLKPEELGTRDEAARKDLERRMTALLGPVRFPGLTPTFSPATLLEGEIDSGGPDGLLFADKDFTTRLLVSPEPVFANWLATRAKDEGMPPAFAKGVQAAAATEAFYTFAISADAAFSSYMPLPVVAAEGETAYAALGLFSQDIAGNSPPDAIVITRVADGRVSVGAVEAKLAIKPMPACDKLWKAAAAKAETLRKAAQKSKKDDDPRFDQAGKIEDEGAAAYRTCFAREAQGQPFLSAAVKRAEGLLAAARGK